MAETGSRVAIAAAGNSGSDSESGSKPKDTPAQAFASDEPRQQAGEADNIEEDDSPDKRSTGRRKITIEFIEDKSRRHITFSKRKAGIMKKVLHSRRVSLTLQAYELSTLTGTQVMLLVASETGHVYTFATPKLQPLITKSEGKALIQACLNSADENEHHQKAHAKEHEPEHTIQEAQEQRRHEQAEEVAAPQYPFPYGKLLNNPQLYARIAAQQQIAARGYFTHPMHHIAAVVASEQQRQYSMAPPLPKTASFQSEQQQTPVTSAVNAV